MTASMALMDPVRIAYVEGEGYHVVPHDFVGPSTLKDEDWKRMLANDQRGIQMSLYQVMAARRPLMNTPDLTGYYSLHELRLRGDGAES